MNTAHQYLKWKFPTQQHYAMYYWKVSEKARHCQYTISRCRTKSGQLQ